MSAVTLVAGEPLRVVTALEDHCDAVVIAAAADLSLSRTLEILWDLRQRGLVECRGIGVYRYNQGVIYHDYLWGLT